MLLSVCLSAVSWAEGASLTEPPIAPATPPEVDGSEQILTPPPAPTAEFKALEKERGLFGRDMNCNLFASYIFQNSLNGIGTAGLKAVFADPNHYGEKLGLAEDALEYKVGLGVALGYDIDSRLTFSIPLITEAALYFKEGSLLGMDPFVAAGLNLNLLGTDFKFGGLGLQLYGGVMKDLGWFGGKSGIAIGYNRMLVEGSRLVQGYYIGVIHPIRL
jgi:hypothetical protein